MHFSTYQRKMWRVMGYLTVGRHYFVQDEAGNYTIKKVPKPVLIYYYTLWVNTFIKVTYMYLTYHGYTKEVHFLDQMSMWDYAFCFSQIFQETIMWYGKYPLYEVLIANWKLQDEIFKKLGSPKHVNDTINKSVRTLVWLHTGIVTVGVTSLMVQYFADPKYALNTYALFDYESFPLLLLFGLHEFLFVYHTWINQATSIHLPEIFAVTYTPLLIEMTKVMYSLIDAGEVQGMKPVVTKEGKENISTQQEKENAENKNNPEGAENINTQKKEVLPEKIERYYPVRKILHPQTKAPGTDYDIDGLLRDYKKLMLAGTAFNKWVGKKMAGIIASNMCTFISDVWMTIQLLREPDFTLLGLYFFFEDSCAGIVILFKMLLVMSRMYPASEEFLHSFKSYLQYDMPRRKYLIKYEKTFKIVTGNIGGYGTRPESDDNSGLNAVEIYCCQVKIVTAVDIAKTCTPEMEWLMIKKYDNTKGLTPLSNTYEEKIGMTKLNSNRDVEKSGKTNSAETAYDIGASITHGDKNVVQVALTANFHQAFISATSKEQESEKLLSQSMDREVKHTISFETPPGVISRIFQLVGSCDIFKIHSIQFRREDNLVNANGQIVKSEIAEIVRKP